MVVFDRKCVFDVGGQRRRAFFPVMTDIRVHYKVLAAKAEKGVQVNGAAFQE